MAANRSLLLRSFKAATLTGAQCAPLFQTFIGLGIDNGKRSVQLECAEFLHGLEIV